MEQVFEFVAAWWWHAAIAAGAALAVAVPVARRLRARSAKVALLEEQVRRLWETRDTLQYHADWADDRNSSTDAKQLRSQVREIDGRIRRLNAEIDEVTGGHDAKKYS